MDSKEVIKEFKKLIDAQDSDALDAFDHMAFTSPTSSVAILSIYLSEDKIVIDISSEGENEA